MHRVGGEGDQLLRPRFRERAYRVTEFDEIRILRVSEQGNFKTACVHQRLQRRKCILVCAAVVRSSEHNNAEPHCHVCHSVTTARRPKSGIAAIDLPIPSASSNEAAKKRRASSRLSGAKRWASSRAVESASEGRRLDVWKVQTVYGAVKTQLFGMKK